MSLLLPEQGQVIYLRHRLWQVQDVFNYQQMPSQPTVHRLLLECLDDDQLAETLDVIWEKETQPIIYENQELPEPVAWDNGKRFEAFLSALQWSTASALERETMQSPFRAAIEIHEYQLEPVVRILTMPRANLLIADDVGLGKTIEAGLVIQELLARRRIRRVLIVCPASLQRQWQEEMQEKFQLRFEIIDRNTVQQLRREFGVHVNPWASHPRLITSMDFLKREQPMRLFQESLQQGKSPTRDWDLLVLDEAHNVAPSGRQHYAIDSDRTRMLRQIANHFEHRIFLTATPHNGFTESFTALLELLDPLRFSRSHKINRDLVKQVMVRRLKDTIKDKMGRREFAERQVLALDVELTGDEDALHRWLRQYTESRLASVDWAESLPLRFALTMLKKRLLSSPQAFENSLRTHRETLGTSRATEDAEILKRMMQRAEEDTADDAEKAQREEDVLIEATKFFQRLSADEQRWLQQMSDAAPDPMLPDSKALRLFAWIDEHLRRGNRWNGERLILFTEYKDTLDYLQHMLTERYGSDALVTLMGGMNLNDREAIKTAFQTNPADNPVRILIATDAASEGLNLQAFCRYLIHYEIPWNPNRMEQRNGRIDRHGQKADVVEIFHFRYTNNEDSHFLETVVEKVNTMRQDLGSVGEVIAAQVEEAMLGRRKTLDVPMHRYQLVREVVQDDVMEQNQIQRISWQIGNARRKLSLYPEQMALVLDEALKLSGHVGLREPLDPALMGKAYQLTNSPSSWRNATEQLLDKGGRRRNLTFDQTVARDRRDVVLLHLNHPLMKRAIDTFRSRIWDMGLRQNTGSQMLHRVSYRVIPDSHLDGPVVIAFGRLVAVGNLAQRLHEEVLPIGAAVNGENLLELGDDVVRDLLTLPYEQPIMPRSLAEEIRRLFLYHKRQLQQLIQVREQAEADKLGQMAEQRGKEDAVAVKRLIEERIKEIEQRISQERKDTSPPGQLALFDREEYLQYQEDLEWLERKRKELRDRLKSEPQQVEDAFKLRSVRVFPLGLLYLLPASFMKE